MGWNDSRIALIPDGRRLVAEERPLMEGGQSVEVLRSERSSSTSATSLKALPIKHWFADSGFSISEESASHARLQSNEIEAVLEIDDEEVSQIILTFTLSKDSPNQTTRWHEIVEKCCNMWGFAIYDPSAGVPVEPRNLMSVIAKTNAWIDFAHQYKW